MDKLAYEALIMNMCKTAGLDGWRSVGSSGCVVVANRAVGLLHCEDDIHDDALSVFVEFDSADRHAPDICKRLLHSNVKPPETLHGFFGVHPDTGKVVYCTRINNARQWSGEALVDFVDCEVREAERVLADLSC